MAPGLAAFGVFLCVFQRSSCWPWALASRSRLLPTAPNTEPTPARIPVRGGRSARRLGCLFEVPHLQVLIELGVAGPGDSFRAPALRAVDLEAGRLAASYGARLIEVGARDGHSGAVTAAARLLAAEGRSGMLTLPADIPLVTPAEIARLLAAHLPAPSFTIVPSHDQRGSNAIAGT